MKNGLEIFESILKEDIDSFGKIVTTIAKEHDKGDAMRLAFSQRKAFFWKMIGVLTCLRYQGLLSDAECSRCTGVVDGVLNSVTFEKLGMKVQTVSVDSKVGM